MTRIFGIRLGFPIKQSPNGTLNNRLWFVSMLHLRMPIFALHTTTYYHCTHTFRVILQCTVTNHPYIIRRMTLQCVEHSSLMLLFLPAQLNYGSITIDANTNNDVNQHLFTCQLCKYKFTCVPFTIGTQHHSASAKSIYRCRSLNLKYYSLDDLHAEGGQGVERYF